MLVDEDEEDDDAVADALPSSSEGFGFGVGGKSGLRKGILWSASVPAWNIEAAYSCGTLGEVGGGLSNTLVPEGRPWGREAG